MMRGMLKGTLVLALAVGLVRAEFSPLSSNGQGQGMPIAQMASRERGMGEVGMAALSTKGFFLPNISRSAYYDRTSFSATLETDMDWVRDHSSASHNMTTAMPTVATFIKTPKIGTFGLYYQQTYQRQFGVLLDTGIAHQGFSADGGLYLLGISYAYSPMPFFSLGVSENVVLGHDRFIQPATFSDSLPDAENFGDTLEMNNWGMYPTFSGTVHTKRYDVALSFTPQARLTTKREEHSTRLLTDSIPDTSRVLPMTLAAGASWRISNRKTAAMDVYYENWSGGGGVLNPAYKVGAGYEYRGVDNPFEDYRKRITYRAGLGYDLLYLQKTPEIYGTLGLGLPLGPRGHALDVSLKYGHRSLDGNTFFTEDYIKISASVVGVSIWGQPARKRH